MSPDFIEDKVGKLRSSSLMSNIDQSSSVVLDRGKSSGEELEKDK